MKLEAELAEVQKKLTTIPANGSFVPEEVERLKAEHKAFSDEIAVTRLEAHPDFRRQYVEPKVAELARARDLLEAHGVKDKAVERLLSLPRAELGKAVAEIVKDIPAFDQVEVSDALRKAYALEQGGQQALAKSKDVLKQIQQNSAARAKQAFDSKWAPVSSRWRFPPMRRRNSANVLSNTTGRFNPFAPRPSRTLSRLMMRAASLNSR